jgi:hypothetical protein
MGSELRTVKNAAMGDAKQQQMEQFRLEGNKNTPLTTYFGTKVSVRTTLAR